MLAKLAGMMDVFQKPFAAKGMLFNYNIPFLDSVLDKVLFVQIKRDPVTNVASVLEARKRQLGDEAAWYSFKIPEFDQLQGLDPITQSAGQIHYINQAVTQGLTKVDESRKLIVQYEEFCDNPQPVFEQLMEKLGMSDERYIGAERFRITRAYDFPNRLAIEALVKQFDIV